MIKSISYNQEEIIQWIMKLYCPNGFEVDPTYSKGMFYKKDVPQPKFKFDISPQTNHVKKSDCCKLPLLHNSVNSIMFDPPFIGASKNNGKDGIIKSRFGYYKDIPSLWVMYAKALVEFYRVLNTNGVLDFKCQDVVEDHKQYFSHVKIITMAAKVGFYPKDLFVLTTKSRLMSPNMKIQQHARKFHCYFIVFIKRNVSLKSNMQY